MFSQLFICNFMYRMYTSAVFIYLPEFSIFASGPSTRKRHVWGIVKVLLRFLLLLLLLLVILVIMLLDSLLAILIPPVEGLRVVLLVMLRSRTREVIRWVGL